MTSRTINGQYLLSMSPWAAWIYVFFPKELRNRSHIICRSGALRFYPKAILCWCLDLEVMFPYHRPPSLCFDDCLWLMMIRYFFINRAEWKAGWFSHHRLVRYTNWCTTSRQSSSCKSNIWLGLYIAIFFGRVSPQFSLGWTILFSALQPELYFLCTQNKAPFTKVPFRRLFTSFRPLHTCSIYPTENFVRALLRSIKGMWEYLEKGHGSGSPGKFSE